MAGQVWHLAVFSRVSDPLLAIRKLRVGVRRGRTVAISRKTTGHSDELQMLTRLHSLRLSAHCAALSDSLQLCAGIRPDGGAPLRTIAITSHSSALLHTMHKL